MPRTEKGTFAKGPQHNHTTRDIKPIRQCPACDAYWAKEHGIAVDVYEENERYENDKAAAEVSGLLAEANKEN